MVATLSSSSSAKPVDRIAACANPPELTLRGVILGALITIVFTASNVFLGLKVGLTFSSAIPAAVISMAVLRLFKNANILENNMVQTQASAAGTLSSIIFILPALVMLGYWHDFPFFQTMAICAAGGMLGVLFTIPLRQVMVVQSDLPYPEGVAAAEILRVGSDRDAGEGRRGAAGDRSAGCVDSIGGEPRVPAAGLRDIATGGIASAAVSVATGGFRVLADSASWWTTAGRAIFQFPLGFSLALLGAGYLIGIVGGIAMLVGLILSWGVAIPILSAVTPIPAGVSIQAFANDLWMSDVRFIGAGVIAIGALWTLATLFMPMVRGVRTSFAAVGRGTVRRVAVPRTEQDLAGGWIMAITLLLVVILVAVFAHFLSDAPLSAGSMWALVGYSVIFAVIFGFLVSAACGYMAGLIGSSSSPISGVGIVALMLMAGMILLLAQGNGLLQTEAGTRIAIALSIFTTSAVVAVAAISNDNLQDLKTGWLVGATPWRQQVALLIGCVVGAAVISPVLELLYNAYGFAGALPSAGMDPTQALNAPQATIMLAIARGIFTHQLNWLMLAIGCVAGAATIAVDLVLARTCKTARLPVLAVGIGIYLPAAVSAPIILGGVLVWALARIVRARALRSGASNTVAEATWEDANRRGVLIASGLIVGESLIGVLMAAIIGISGTSAPLALVGPGFAPIAAWLGLLAFCLVAAILARRVLR